LAIENNARQNANEAKRSSVIALLSDPEWSARSATEIAKECAVSRNFVNSIRRLPPFNKYGTYRKFVHKSGKTTQIRVDTIGSRRDYKPSQDDEDALIATCGGRCVYLVQSEHLTKIAFTTSARQRLRDLKNDNPFASLVAVIANGDTLLKRRLHEMFSNKKIVGDWFELSADDFEKIYGVI
jgi:T5orf172 domain